MMNTTEHDEHMRKRMHELLEKHHVNAMHSNIKQHDMHLHHMEQGKHKFTVPSANQLAKELKE